MDFMQFNEKELNTANQNTAGGSFSLETIKKSFSWYKTGRINLAYECIDKHTEGKLKDKRALVCLRDGSKDIELTFNDLKNYTDQFSRLLLKNGLSKGDKVLIWLPRIPEFYISLMGVIKAGGIPVPLSEFSSSKLIMDILENTQGTTYMVTTPLFLNTLQPIPPKLKTIIINENDDFSGGSPWEFHMKDSLKDAETTIRWVDFSDGLTAHYSLGCLSKPKPKLTFYKQDLMLLIRQYGEWVLSLKESDTLWSTVDMGWAAGTLYGIFAPWLMGATVVSADMGTTLTKWEEITEKYEINVLYTTPGMIRKIMAKNNKKNTGFKHLRHICCTGEPISAEITKWALNLGLSVNSSWFATEIGVPAISNHPPSPSKLGAMGRPLPGIEAAVFDSKGNRLNPYQVGKLGVRFSVEGLSKKEDSEHKEAPWFLTEDLVYIDNEGYFWYEGKADNLKRSAAGAGAFYESQWEARLLKHPAVEEAGVIIKGGKYNEEKIIKAFISLKDKNQWGAELERELINYLLQGIKENKPKVAIELRDKLPMTRSGKILRHILAAWDENNSLKRANNL
ncbi:MAG: AMP-binding protein [Clostridia bacterium]|nr:AMP-binding protein [Clostridia bacterium]